jgi:nicotinamidase-related amidase
MGGVQVRIEGARMKQALLLVDIQNDYFPGGKMELVGMEEALRNARLLLAMFRQERLPVVHIQHISKRPGATFFLPNTTGAAIHDSVAPQPGEVVLEKQFPNGFRDTDLSAVLAMSEVNQVVICGAMSHMCIDATTRAAFDLGFRCTVIGNACATRDLEYQGIIIEASKVHAAFMGALAQVYASVVSVDEYTEMK